jgi:hypothetical protein
VNMANRGEECRLRAEQCEQTAKAAEPHLASLVHSVNFVHPSGCQMLIYRLDVSLFLLSKSS